MVSLVVIRRTLCSAAGGGVSGPLASCAHVIVVQPIASIAATAVLPIVFILLLYFSGFIFACFNDS